LLSFLLNLKFKFGHCGLILGHAKVAQHYCALRIDEIIGWCYISMHESSRVEEVQGTKLVVEDADNFILS
jgi:hypothetical protein